MRSGLKDRRFVVLLLPTWIFARSLTPPASRFQRVPLGSTALGVTDAGLPAYGRYTLRAC